MAIYDYLKQEELVDLLKAYDQYITEASNADAFRTGWVPVCIEEFYEAEYQDVWKQQAEFSEYFYEAVDMAAADLSAQSLAAAIDAFYWVYDTYNYQDNCPDRAAAISQIEEDIQSGKTDEIIGCLQTEILERAEATSATLALKIIIGQLEQYQQQQHAVMENTQKPNIKFSEVSDALLIAAGNGLDVWVTTTDGDEFEFSDMRLYTDDYAEFSPNDKWLFDLAVEKIWRNDDGTINSVILNSGLTRDELVFLLGLEPDLLVDDQWRSAIQRAEQVGASFDDRLKQLKNKSSTEYLEQLEGALEAVEHALEAVDLAEINGKNLHPSIGNHLVTAQMVLSEAFETAIEDARKPMITKLDKLVADANDRCLQQPTEQSPIQIDVSRE